MRIIFDRFYADIVESNATEDQRLRQIDLADIVIEEKMNFKF